jgi:hypothetical protein
MTNSTIIIRLSKSFGNFKKYEKYHLTIDDDQMMELDDNQNKLVMQLEAGKHILEIKDENSTIVKELRLKNGQLTNITVYKKIPYQLGLGIMLGMAFVGLIIQLMFLKTILLPINLIPFIPLLFFTTQKKPNSFEISIN